ncbi:MAG TPA: hypothetical protein VEP90_24640, partial [Methylomirabilota bacterium]|nr:hypothetical protein [Methylomirabilota bacterium]
DVVIDNLAAQSALQLVEGGTGIVEAKEDVSSKNMSFAAAVTYGNQLLTRYCISGRTATFKTYRNGLVVGQMLPAWIPEENLNYAQLLVHSIDLGMQTQPNNTVLYNYIVQASELPVLSSWSKLLASGLLD